MKKKVIIVLIVVILLILLVPIPFKVKDGGTIEYKSLTYKVSRVHRLLADGGYEDGLIIEVFGIEFYNNVKQNRLEQYKKQETESINVVTEVSLGERAWIDSLTKINIKDSNDYFEITEKVKWDVPEHSEDMTISFTITVPYIFVVNGVSYSGIYELNDASWSKEPEGLDYNLSVINLTKDGKIEIEVTK